MINNKSLLSSFVICFFIKIIKILEIIKNLNDFYDVVRSKELGSSSSFISLISSFIFSYVFFSVIILVNSS